jgi:vacuolar-type H+-ATPase subunit H
MIESPDIVKRLQALVESGSAFFSLFDRSLVPRTRVLELLEMLQESLPAEFEQAREIVGQRDQVLEEARRLAGEIVDEAVRRAERLVDADLITTEARKRAREIMSESDEYVTGRLVQLEGELDRLLAEVRAGIEATGGRAQTKSGARDRPGRTLDKP